MSPKDSEEGKNEKTETEHSPRAKKAANSLMTHNINIALSDQNNSQNLNCKIETGSNHQISISSKAEDRVRFWV